MATLAERLGYGTDDRVLRFAMLAGQRTLFADSYRGKILYRAKTRRRHRDLQVHPPAGPGMIMPWPHGWVGHGRGVRVAPGPFPVPARRTGRACLHASGSPRVLPVAQPLAAAGVQGVGMFAPR